MVLVPSSTLVVIESTLFMKTLSVPLPPDGA